MIKTKPIVQESARKENSQLILIVGQRSRPHATSVVSTWETRRISGRRNRVQAEDKPLDSQPRNRISDSF